MDNDHVNVLILGAGFGGMSTANAICDALPDEVRRNQKKILMVDRWNYHLYTPCLFQAATGLVGIDHITRSIRANGTKKGFNFVKANAESINLQKKSVRTSLGNISYDYLVIALGSVKDDSRMPGATENSIPLKTLQDGQMIHNRIVASFEKAATLTSSDSERKAFLNFVVIGGTTGVELASAIFDYIKDVAKEYPSIDVKRECLVYVIEEHDRLFPGSDRKLSEIVKETLDKRGIRVLVDTKIRSVDPSIVNLEGGRTINAKNIFFNADIAPNPIVNTFPAGLIAKHHDRIIVDEHLRIPNFEEVYVVGDISAARAHGSEKDREEERRGRNEHNSVHQHYPHSRHEHYAPPTAEAAVEEGKYAGRDIADRILMRERLGDHVKGISLKEKGIMLSLGHHSGLAKFKHATFRGYSGWLIWRFVHLVLLSTTREKIGVFFDWSFGSFGRRNTSQLAQAIDLSPTSAHGIKSPQIPGEGPTVANQIKVERKRTARQEQEEGREAEQSQAMTSSK